MLLACGLFGAQELGKEDGIPDSGFMIQGTSVSGHGCLEFTLKVLAQYRVARRERADSRKQQQQHQEQEKQE